MKQIDPKMQFSKKLARWTSAFWFAFMVWLSVLFLLAPETALYCVYMAIVSTVVMTLSVWAYTKNSIYEKGLLAMIDKTKLELSLKDSNKPSSDDKEEIDPEGGSNG